MNFVGEVTKGLGRAKKFINMMSEAFYKTNGINLFPGTLNIKLKEPYNLKPDYIIKAEEYGGNFNVQVQKCKIFEQDAYIVRSEKNIENKGDYKQNIIEIISDLNFREKYNLKDGDIVQVLIK